MEKSKKRRLNFGMAGVILALAWPTMLEQLMQTAVQYIDTAMVGSLGTQATAAVGATTTVNWLVGSTISAVGVGFLVFIAKALGAGDKSAAKKAASQALLSVSSKCRAMKRTMSSARLLPKPENRAFKPI